MSQLVGELGKLVSVLSHPLTSVRDDKGCHSPDARDYREDQLQQVEERPGTDRAIPRDAGKARVPERDHDQRDHDKQRRQDREGQ